MGKRKRDEEGAGPVQLELDLNRRERGTGDPLAGARRLSLLLLEAAPIWAPAILALLLFQRGLAPALRESDRMHAAEVEVGTRVEGLWQARERISRELRALSDPIYRERVKKSLVSPNSAPLTLESALTLEPPSPSGAGGTGRD